MARNVMKASKTQLICKIMNIEPDPKHANRMIVSVQFDDGDILGPWIQGFSLLPDKPFTMDDFMDLIYQQKIERPTDPYGELKRWQKSGKEFVLKFTSKIIED